MRFPPVARVCKTERLGGRATISRFDFFKFTAELLEEENKSTFTSCNWRSLLYVLLFNLFRKKKEDKSFARAIFRLKYSFEVFERTKCKKKFDNYYWITWKKHPPLFLLRQPSLQKKNKYIIRSVLVEKEENQ